LNHANFEFISNLQFTVKALEARVRAFESGELYQTLQTRHEKQLAAQDREIRALKLQLTDAHAQIVTNRRNTFQVYEDMEKAHADDLAKKERELRAMEKRALKAERERDELREKLREKQRELYHAQTELEEEQGRNRKITAQINRDYENSSIPSSQKLNRKKIVNSREKTGRKPGGQPGHTGHRRRKLTPSRKIEIPVPERFAHPDFTPTGRTITKQVIGISLQLNVTEYATPEFRNVRTGQRVHADFPAGLVNEVSYDGSVKAFLYLLNSFCNVSLAKCSQFLEELTDGRLRISTGMMNGLARTFARQTADMQKKAFADMLLAPVMHTDYTPMRVNGKQVQVLVCANEKQVLYFARHNKGHTGIKGTPAEDHQGTLTHDHDLTFYNYGRWHQECLEHVLRYLLSSIQNEPDRSWNTLMRELIREMIHFRNSLSSNEKRNPDEVDPEKVMLFEQRFDDILRGAKDEYEYDPPSKYFVDGFNLSKKLRKYRDNHLLFLHDIRVPPTNNSAERPIRTLKRKLAQVMTFRSFDSLDYLCQGLGVIASLRIQNKNLYHEVVALFDAQQPASC